MDVFKETVNFTHILLRYLIVAEYIYLAIKFLNFVIYKKGNTSIATTITTTTINNDKFYYLKINIYRGCI